MREQLRRQGAKSSVAHIQQPYEEALVCSYENGITTTESKDKKSIIRELNRKIR